MPSINADLESWFLHHDLVFKVLGSARSAQLAAQLPHEGQVFARTITKDLLERALAQAVGSLAVPSLNALHLTQELAVGKLVWLEQALYYRGIEAAYYKSKLGTDTDPHRGSVWGKLATDRSLHFEAELNASRVTSDTGAHLMSGTRSAFMLAYIDGLEGGRVLLRAVAIGRRLVSYDELSQSISDVAQVWPKQVNAFKDVDFSQGRRSDLELLRKVSEEDIKRWFVEIIGQPEVAKACGGERYDLWTQLLSVKEVPMRAAILFKASEALRPMEISDLGKNGEQIQRLAESPADLLVVQHCNAIGPGVKHMLRTYATSPTRVRNYMLIDGYETAAILKHFEYLPAD